MKGVDTFEDMFEDFLEDDKSNEEKSIKQGNNIVVSDDIDDFLDTFIEEPVRENIDIDRGIEDIDSILDNDYIEDNEIEDNNSNVSNLYKSGITIGEVENIDNSTVNTDILKTDLDSIRLYRSFIPNLHINIALADSPRLKYSKAKYTREELGLPFKEDSEEDKDTFGILDKDKCNLKVGQNGLTLGDYFANKRKRNERNVIRNILDNLEDKTGEKINPYRRGVEKESIELNNIQKKVNQEKKIKSDDGSAFLSRYKKGTAFESRLAKNLGIDKESLKNIISPKSVLSEKEKAILLSLGSGVDNRAVKKKRKNKYVTVGDMEVLLYLDKAKLASLRNVYYACGMKKNLYLELKRLERLGLVQNIIVTDATGLNVWGLTELGAAYIGSERILPNKNKVRVSSLSERIFVNHVLACLFSGCINILQLEEYPVYNRINIETGEAKIGEDIVPETDILSSRSNKIMELKGNLFVEDSFKGESTKSLREQWNIGWAEWEMNGRRGLSPEEVEGNEWYYILMYQGGVYLKSYLLPDIVVKRPRSSDGSPNSIAIEVEREVKSIDELKAKLEMYKMDNRVYSKVIYVTSNKRIAENISEAAAQIGFDRYDVVPMINENGIVKKSMSHWEI
jgi:hypothetical protein